LHLKLENFKNKNKNNMANTSSAKKQYRKSIKQRLVNLNNLSRIKTFIKKISVLVDSNQRDEAKKIFGLVQSEIMRGVKKKVIKLNTASRKISQISKKIKG
jgi:small subunit ribosomal protein S20